MSAELSVIPGFKTVPRLKAPKDLSKAQMAHFHALTAAKPADYFQACDLPLLVQLCRHLNRADEIDRQFKAELTVPEYDELARMADRETKQITSLMTRLRLTPQSRYRADAERNFKAGRGDPLDILMRMDDE